MPIVKQKSEKIYIYISEKKEIKVNVEEQRTNIWKFLIFILNKKFEKTKKIFMQIAIDKEPKPIREPINIFYSNSPFFLYLIL